tara:strand:- start:44 stop:1066 length:1023 start_codon:yes stop_codon:yes gene_type:complete
MPCTIKNPANLDLSTLEPHVQGMYDFFDQKIGFNKPPTMIFDSDPSNQANVLGKTAYYDPSALEIHVYSDGRHPKDMLRSIAHELIHHRQNLEGRLDVGGYHGEGYYLENEELKKLEHEAMLEGNALMREYEDTLKRKEIKEMSLNEWKNNELNKLLMKKFGILKENKEITHMCALEVTHKKTGKKGHPIKHTLSESGQISHYTVEFKNVIVENIAIENLDVVVQEMHTHKRDDEKDHDEDKKIVKEEELEEGAMPDYPDVDGDGDKDEPISKAQKEKKSKEGDDDDDDGDEGDKDMSKVPPQLRDHVKSKKNESKVNIKEVVRKVLENNKRIMEKLKDK